MNVMPQPDEAERQRAEAIAELAKMPLGGNLVGNLRAIQAARDIQRKYPTPEPKSEIHEP